MAVLGLTKLGAVNRMLRAIGELPVAALDPSGASLASRAEELLDDVRQGVLVRGYYSNLIKCKEYTPALNAGNYEIALASNVLKVRAAGPNQHRNLTIQGDKVYDLDNGTTNFGAATPHIFIDIWLNISFEDMSPDMKEFVANEASSTMYRRWKGDTEGDNLLKEETAKAELNTDKVRPSVATDPINPMQSLTAALGGGQARGQ